MLPATAAYVVFSSSLLDILKGKISREMIIGLFLILFVSAIPFLIQKLQKRMGKK
jgi:hypothetical protein